MKKKNITKNKKTFIVSLLLVVAIAGAAITMALAIARSNNVINTFEAADHSTEIEEKVDSDLTKTVWVKNTAKKSPAFIRVRLTVSPEELQKSLVLDEKALDEGKWIDGEDGFYYYLTAVPAGGKTDALLSRVDGDSEVFKKFTGDSFDIVVYEESCVATVAGGKQERLENIKAAFDAATGE